jgi:hypothetical protein
MRLGVKKMNHEEVLKKFGDVELRFLHKKLWDPTDIIKKYVGSDDFVYKPKTCSFVYAVCLNSFDIFASFHESIDYDYSPVKKLSDFFCLKLFRVTVFENDKELTDSIPLCEGHKPGQRGLSFELPNGYLLSLLFSLNFNLNYHFYKSLLFFRFRGSFQNYIPVHICIYISKYTTHLFYFFPIL